MSSAGSTGHNVNGLMQAKERPVVIVAGYLVVEPQQRDSYLVGCQAVVQQARRAPGCLDFAISADLIEPDRINIFERWESADAVESFRGDGISEEQQGAIVDASVSEYHVGSERLLT